MTNVETFKNLKAIYYPFLFMIRRLIMALTITLLDVNVVLQMEIAVNCSLFMLCWLLTVKPLESKSKNRLECINEYFILLFTYWQLMFTNFVPVAVTRYLFGYVYLGLLGLLVLTNVGITVHSIFSEFI